MLQIGLAIALIVVCGSYKEYPTLSKRTGIKVMTVILTVLASIKALSALFGIIPSYYGTEDFVFDGLAALSATVFALVVIYYGGVITISVIACVKGYKCMGNDELTNAALNEQLRVNSARSQQIFRNQSVTDVQQSFTTENTAWQCGSCGKYNESENKFCIYCGHVR